MISPLIFRQESLEVAALAADALGYFGSFPSLGAAKLEGDPEWVETSEISRSVSDSCAAVFDGLGFSLPEFRLTMKKKCLSIMMLVVIVDGLSPLHSTPLHYTNTSHSCCILPVHCFSN